MRRMRWSRQVLVQLLRAVQRRQAGSQAAGPRRLVRLLLTGLLQLQGRVLRLVCQPTPLRPHTSCPMLRKTTMMLTDGRA
jgi:hypothetical protein